MNNTMEYRGYLGSVEFSEEDALFFGKVLGVRALISYEGENARELVESFHGAVDDYLVLCAKEGITPEKAYKGSFKSASLRIFTSGRQPPLQRSRCRSTALWKVPSSGLYPTEIEISFGNGACCNMLIIAAGSLSSSYGLHLLQGSYPISMISSLVPV